MIYVEIQTELVVTGENPEMADFENPRGEIYGVNARVVVETEQGHRYIHGTAFEGRNDESAAAKAEPLRAKIEAHVKAGGKLDLAHWEVTQPRYGSVAYERGGWEQAQIFNERQEG